MIWGCQYDQIIKWAECANTVRSNDTYGQDGGVNIASRTGVAYKDGTTYDKIKNIYDLAGNLSEATQTALGDDRRAARGGNFSQAISKPASEHGHGIPASTGAMVGSRMILYIK